MKELRDEIEDKIKGLNTARRALIDVDEIDASNHYSGQIYAYEKVLKMLKAIENKPNQKEG